MHRIMERYLRNENPKLKDYLIVLTIIGIIFLAGTVFYTDSPNDQTATEQVE